MPSDQPPAAPAYGAPTQPGYAAPAYGTTPSKPTPVFSLISLIAGIIGLVGFFVVFIPFVGGIMQLFIPAAAVVLGFIGKRKEPAAKGMWLTGIILGFVGVAIGLLSLLLWGIFAATVGSMDYSTY
ncbi:hypothetical protein ESP51_11575 [Agromyces albus]|uniref:DUF4190 domain-containing protein n=2 Tax=Agromyces albus TaxID=205332 RepID=A0A4Q2KVY2_9MICO|nr:hypothetical protein ESP51_11575 [Agromyces albus]